MLLQGDQQRFGLCEARNDVCVAHKSTSMNTIPKLHMSTSTAVAMHWCMYLGQVRERERQRKATAALDRRCP